MSPPLIDFDKVCRLCFREDDGCCKMTSIHGRRDLEETIRKCVQVEVLLDSEEPSNICASCMLSLDSWSKFKMLCDSTNDFLQQYILDKNESDLVLNSEMMNLGILGFTPSHMSDLSFGFLENDSLWNNSISQQWSEVDPTCTDSPVPRCMKKLQPPEGLIIDSLFSDDCMDMTLSKKDDNLTNTKPHQWNSKAISMKKTMQKDTNKYTTKGGISKSMSKYIRYTRKSYSCNVCSETFTKFNNLIIHDSTVHVDLSKDFGCKTCGKLFLSKERLEIHESVHREKLFQCNLCQKKFTLQKTLDKHLNIHIGLYTCKICSYKAPSMYNLKIHENTHSLVKDLRCENCEKLFSTLSSLRRHNRLIHKKLFVFRCDQCDYSTIQPTNFKYHKSTHGSQSFVCDHCGSSFKHKELFMLHLKSHEEPQFSCTVCSKMFKKKSSLKEHLSCIHELGPSVKKHKCEVCQKGFTRIKYLRSHKNTCDPTKLNYMSIVDI